MEEFTYTLSNGKKVHIINPSGTGFVYEVYTMEREQLGFVYVDGDDGTDSPALAPYIEEILQAIYNHNRPQL